MADNTLQQENKSIGTEDIGGHQIQCVKIMQGAPNVNDGNVSASNPLVVMQEAVSIVRGLIPGKSHVHVSGTNPTIQAATPENIWANGGLYTFAPAAETMSLVSGDQADNGTTATGALTVLITGLDATGLETTELLTLNGTTPVISASMTHVQKVEVVTAGSTGSNEGAISVTGVDSGLTFANFGIGKNSSSLGHYKVPSDKTGYIEKIVFSAAKNAGAGVLLTIQRRRLTEVFRTIAEIATGPNGLTYEFTTPPAMPAGTEMKLLAEVLGNGTQVSVFIEILLVDD